jgi:hypothetical protein
MEATTMDLADLADRWARAICAAASLQPEVVRAALGVGLAGAGRLGRQVTCTPPPGVATLTLILGGDSGDLTAARIRPTVPPSVTGFAERFGPFHVAPPGPHELVPTFIFGEVHPAGMPRACAILVRPGDDWPDEHLVGSVTLFPR